MLPLVNMRLQRCVLRRFEDGGFVGSLCQRVVHHLQGCDLGNGPLQIQPTLFHDMSVEDPGATLNPKRGMSVIRTSRHHPTRCAWYATCQTQCASCQFQSRTRKILGQQTIFMRRFLAFATDFSFALLDQFLDNCLARFWCLEQVWRMLGCCENLRQVEPTLPDRRRFLIADRIQVLAIIRDFLEELALAIAIHLRSPSRTPESALLGPTLWYFSTPSILEISALSMGLCFATSGSVRILFSIESWKSKVTNANNSQVEANKSMNKFSV